MFVCFDKADDDNLNDFVVFWGRVSSVFYIICNDGTKYPCCFIVVEGVVSISSEFP